MKNEEKLHESRRLYEHSGASWVRQVDLGDHSRDTGAGHDTRRGARRGQQRVMARMVD